MLTILNFISYGLPKVLTFSPIDLIDLYIQIQMQRASSSDYFKSLKELVVFMKEPANNHWFFDFFHIFFENCGHTSKLGFQKKIENWQVNGYITGLITCRYLLLILITAQHW
jgi:hypothetical protein